jgi:DNA polymerase III alpha subunit (gram-positive type)
MGDSGGIHVIFFDLETTGFQDPIRPIQIGAIDSWGKKEYNKFILPDRPVEHHATSRHGFIKDNETLCCRHGQALDSMDLRWGLLDFLEWLRSFGGQVILMAHNCRQFDARVLLQCFRDFSVPYEDVILGFSDSLVASRFLFPGREFSHRLPDMLVNVNLRRYETQDAKENAKICRRVVRRMAAQNQKRFVEFVQNPRWYKNLEQQKNWTFSPPKRGRGRYQS